MAPQLGGHDEVLQEVPGHDAEVAHAYGVAGQQPMEEAVEMVEDAEDQPFGPARPLGEDDLAMTAFLQLPEKGGDVRRAVLTVAVHDQDGLTGEVGMDVREAYRDRPLMSEVLAEAEVFDLPDREQRPALQELVRAGGRWSHRPPAGDRTRTAGRPAPGPARG